MPTNNPPSVELTQQQQLQQQQQQHKQTQKTIHVYNRDDESSSLDKTRFIGHISSKWRKIYRREDAYSLLESVFEKMYSVGAADFGNYSRKKDAGKKNHDFSRLKTDSLDALHEGLDALIAPAKNKDFISMVELVRVVMNLMISGNITDYGNNFLIKDYSTNTEKFLDVLEKGFYLGRVFDLLVGNIQDLGRDNKPLSCYEDSCNGLELPFPDMIKLYISTGGQLDASHMTISEKACDHFFEIGFDKLMGARIWIDIDPNSKRVANLKIKDLPESLEGLYIERNTLCCGSQSQPDEKKKYSAIEDKNKIIASLKNQGVFDKTSDKSSAWILLAMVKNDHSFRACIPFEALVNDESYNDLKLKNTYNVFLNMHNSFVANLQDLWGKSFFNEISAYRNTYGGVSRNIQNIGNTYARNKVLAEIERQKESFEVFCEKIEVLLSFAVDVFHINFEEGKKGMKLEDFMPIKIRDMLPPQQVDEDVLKAKQESVEYLVAKHITGFEDLRRSFEMQQELFVARDNQGSEVQDKRKSNSKILQDCLTERVSFVFQVSNIFAVSGEHSVFNRDKFFKILAFHLFKEAFGKKYTLSQFKTFCDKLEADVPGIFTKMFSSSYGASSDYGFNSNNAKKLVESNSLLRSPSVRNFYNALKVVGADISQHRILTIIANPISAKDKSAQARALLDLVPYAMHFRSQFISQKQDNLHLKNSFLGLHCYPVSIIEDGFGRLGECETGVREFIHDGRPYYNREHPCEDSVYIISHMKNTFGNGEINLAHLMIAMAREYQVAYEESYRDIRKEKELDDNADKVFHVWAARIPYYEYTAFESIDDQIKTGLASTQISPQMRRKIRHSVLESALVDRNQKDTLENWKIIIESIAEIFAFKTAGANAAVHTVVTVNNVVSGAFDTSYDRNIYLDSYIEKVMANLRYCSSHAIKAYVRAYLESNKEKQLVKGINICVQSFKKEKGISGQDVRFSYNVLAPVTEFLHKKGLGMAFLNGLTDINLAPFIPDSENEEDEIQKVDDESAEEERYSAESKAVYQRLAFFMGAYEIEQERGYVSLNRWRFKEYEKPVNSFSIRDLNEELQCALLRGLATKNHECFAVLVQDIAENFKVYQEKILAHCIETAVRINAAVDDDLLKEFVSLARNSKKDDSLDTIDAAINRIKAIKDKGGIAARDFGAILNRININYMDDITSKDYIEKIICSIKSESRSMRHPADLIAEFTRLKDLNRSMRHLALEKIVYLGGSNIQESSLLFIVKMLNSNEAAGSLTNFAEAVTDLRNKRQKLPDNLLETGVEFLSACAKGISTPAAKVSLAKSLLLGYEKGEMFRDTSIIEFHTLSESLFNALDEEEVKPFVIFNKSVENFKVALNSYNQYKAATSEELYKMSTLSKDLNDLQTSKIPDCETSLESAKKVLEEAKEKQSAIDADISNAEKEIETLKTSCLSNIDTLEDEKKACNRKRQTIVSEDEIGAAFSDTSDRPNSDRPNNDESAIKKKIDEIDTEIAALKLELEGTLSKKNALLEEVEKEKETSDEEVLKAGTTVQELEKQLASYKLELKHIKESASIYIEEVSKCFIKHHNNMNNAKVKLDHAISDSISKDWDVENIVKESGYNKQVAIDFYNNKRKIVTDNCNFDHKESINDFCEVLQELLQRLPKESGQNNDYGIKDQINYIKGNSTNDLDLDLNNQEDAGNDTAISFDSLEVGATALHARMCKILAKRVSASEDLWTMLDNAFISKIPLDSLDKAILCANSILEEYLPGEASVIFSAIIKYYRSSPQHFIRFVEDLDSPEFSDKNKALLLKLAYAYIENGEGLDGIGDLFAHLADNQEKAGILGSRLVHPPYWSAIDIQEKDLDDLHKRTSYPRVPREYGKFDSVVAKFKSSVAEDLFAGTFEKSSFKDYLEKKDQDRKSLVAYQNYLTEKRNEFRDGKKVTDKDILDVAFAVSEVLANVSFDKDQHGNKKAKELRLEQIMSVYAWLKLGMTGDADSQTTVWNQVETGEGKSRITAVLAGAAAVLSGGKTIEMTFNSQALALRGLEEFSFLFEQMFNEKVSTNIGLVIDPQVNPAAYKSSKPEVQAVNFISISHYLLASKASDVSLVNYLTEENRNKVEKMPAKSAFIVSAEDCADAKQEILNLDVPIGSISVINNENIYKAIEAYKALNEGINVVVVSLKEHQDVENIIVKKDGHQVDFTDRNGIIRIVDEADDGSNLHMPCNISSSNIGNGYWDGPNGDDGIYRHITEWSFEKLAENGSLSSDSLTTKDRDEFITFVNKEEEKENSSKDSSRIMSATLENVDLSQLRIWFDSVKAANNMQMGVDFVLEDGYRGEYGENCFAIIPLNSGGAAMPGSIFSKGVHQILRYLVNANKAIKIVRKKTMKERFLSLLGWQIQDRGAIPDKRIRLARPVESPIVASKKNLIVSLKSAQDVRDENIKTYLKTTGTPPLQVASAAGDKILETPRATDLKRVHLPTVYAPDTLDKVRSIVRDVTECMLEERPCMVLCEDEKESDFVYSVLDKFVTADIRKYSSTLSQEKQSELVKSAGQVGKVTVGPVVDLGRGIDVVPNESAIKNGGMHLIMTSYPEDRATYLQAVARSGRNGVRGTVRLIVEGNIDSESAVASRVKSYNKNADIAQIQAVFDAPWNTFEKKVRELELGASNQTLIDTLRAKLHEYQEGNKDEALYLVQNALSSRFLRFFGLLRFIGIPRAKRILEDYHARVVSEYNKSLASQNIDEKLKKSLVLSTVDFDAVRKDSLEYLQNLREAYVKSQDVPVVAEYDPSHAGQAVLYSNPLWFIDATIKGHNVIFDHLFALFRGGEFFPNLKASIYSWRILPPVIAEIREYFKLEAGSNDANIVKKSLLKISSYSMFLGGVLLVPFFAGWPLALGVSSLFVAGSYLYYKSSLIKVKGSCEMLSRSRLEASFGLGVSKRSDFHTTYVAPLYLRRASQILVFALCIAMIAGAYFACVPLFSLIYAKVGVTHLLSEIFFENTVFAAINFADLHSYIFTLMLAFSMYEFYNSEDTRHLFDLPRNLVVDTNNKLLGVIYQFGKKIIAISVGMVGLYVTLSCYKFMLYDLITVILLYAIYLMPSTPFIIIAEYAVLPIIVTILVRSLIFVKRLFFFEISSNEFKTLGRYLIDLALSNIVTMVNIVQIAAMFMILSVIITPYPPLLFLGVNIIPLIHSGIIATYLVCCLDQCKYLFARALYLSHVHMKKDIIGKDSEKAKLYRDRNSKTLLGSAVDKIKLLLQFFSKNSLAEVVKGNVVAQDGKPKTTPIFNIDEEEKNWRQRNSVAIQDRNKNMLISVVKSLLAGVAAAGSYMLVVAMMPSSIGLMLALAAAIYVGIFVDSYIEDVGFCFAFGTKSNFVYLLPDVKKVNGGSLFWYSVKSNLQKTINAIMVIFLSPLYFAFVTLKLPFKSVLNIVRGKNSNIANMQLANLISFIITFLFLLMVSGASPLAGIPLIVNIFMALYLNGMLSFGLMKFFGVVSAGNISFAEFQGESNNSFITRVARFTGIMSDLICGCDIVELYSYNNEDRTRSVENEGFKPWVEGNANPKFIDDTGIGHKAYSPLGRINNFKGA